MSSESSAPVPRWSACLAGGILAAVLWLALWLPAHSPRPHLPTSDLYTHLTVARHLTRGEGFSTDVIYPLSFAFPFARSLPQPLIHRQPGYAVLLTIPYFAGNGDPHRVEIQVRRLQVVLVALVLAVGTAALWRRGRRTAVLPWLILMYFNPMLVFAVDWGMVELVCSLVLLVLWLRMRNQARVRPGWVDGMLAGLLCLIRLDLFWIPLLWWVLFGASPAVGRLLPRPDRRRLIQALLVWLVVITPWVLRNIQLTGQPFFSLQGYAEHVKDTRTWPEYTVYRQLEPQPFFDSLRNDPVPILRKVARGMRFYVRDLDRLLPAVVLAVFGWGVLGFLAHRYERGVRYFPGPSTQPLAAAGLTLFFLCFQYSFFDHSLRHLLVILPVMLWEVSGWIGNVAHRLLQRPDRPRGVLPQPLGGIALAVTIGLVATFIFPCRIPGWNFAAREAVNLVPVTRLQVESMQDAPAGVLFVDNAAVPWFIDRPVVWAPIQPETRRRICEFLGQPEVTP